MQKKPQTAHDTYTEYIQSTLNIQTVSNKCTYTMKQKKTNQKTRYTHVTSEILTYNGEIYKLSW